MKIQGGFFGHMVEQVKARAKEQMRALVDGFKAALERKDPKELAQILKDVKALSVKGEKQFLEAFLEQHGNSPAVQEGLQAGRGSTEIFRDLVTSSLSSEQRQALARELMPKLGGKFGKLVKTEGLEAFLGKYLGTLGKDPHRFFKDGLIRAPQLPNPFPTPPVTVPDPQPGPFGGRRPILDCHPHLPGRPSRGTQLPPLSQEEIKERLEKLPPEVRDQMAWLEHERQLAADGLAEFNRRRAEGEKKLDES